jgi:hypothetical protein
MLGNTLPPSLIFAIPSFFNTTWKRLLFRLFACIKKILKSSNVCLQMYVENVWKAFKFTDLQNLNEWHFCLALTLIKPTFLQVPAISNSLKNSFSVNFYHLSFLALISTILFSTIFPVFNYGCIHAHVHTQVQYVYILCTHMWYV